MKLRLLLASSLLAASVALSANATDYAIKLTRGQAVGERYRITTTASDEQVMTMKAEGQDLPRRADHLVVEMVAGCEVLALTPGGRVAKTKLTIEKLNRVAGGQSTELLPPGAEVIAERLGQNTSYMVNGERASGPVAKALEITCPPMNSDSEATDQAVFGTSERKKVGDSWPINAAAAAADLAKRGVPADASNITGQATLAEVINQDGEPLLRITAYVTINGIKPPLPPGVEVQQSEMRADFSGLFPADVTKRPVQESMALNLAFSAGGTTQGKTMAMTMTKKTSRDSKFSRN